MSFNIKQLIWFLPSYFFLSIRALMEDQNSKYFYGIICCCKSAVSDRDGKNQQKSVENYDIQFIGTTLVLLLYWPLWVASVLNISKHIAILLTTKKISPHLPKFWFYFALSPNIDVNFPMFLLFLEYMDHFEDVEDYTCSFFDSLMHKSEAKVSRVVLWYEITKNEANSQEEFGNKASERAHYWCPPYIVH